MKGIKEERHEIYSIQGDIIKKRLYNCIIEVKLLKTKSKILNEEEIKVTYDCIVKKLK